MKKTRRTSRVGENVRDALVQVLRSDLRDFDMGWSSISEVEVSPDLHYARVYITGLKEEDTKQTVEELRERAGQARYALGKRIQLRFTPELDFRYDETAMRALRVETLLREVIPPNPENETNDDDSESGDDERES
ncbi:MAG TPA: 30S ribosome-binding factor RbfA [Thermoanaerobaculia bacterium]|jgi:ribosome-binding factor A|nr:30S ribosome-binding factor RbfA [Thermoanaerobaculia bacterium]